MIANLKEFIDCEEFFREIVDRATKGIVDHEEIKIFVHEKMKLFVPQ